MILVTQKELTAMGLGGRTKIYTMMKENDFPKPFGLYGRSRRWLLADVQQWIARQNPNTTQHTTPEEA